MVQTVNREWNHCVTFNSQRPSFKPEKSVVVTDEQCLERAFHLPSLSRKASLLLFQESDIPIDDTHKQSLARPFLNLIFATA